MVFPGGSVVKNPPANAGNAGYLPAQEGPLEKGMAAHSGILAWEISRAEEPGGLQSMGRKRVGHDLVTEQQWTDTKASTLHRSANSILNLTCEEAVLTTSLS